MAVDHDTKIFQISFIELKFRYCRYTCVNSTDFRFPDRTNAIHKSRFNINLVMVGQQFNVRDIHGSQN